MNQKDIRVLQLYPKDMNIYGDWGNVLVIKRRLQWHGYNPIILDYNPGDDFPENIDILIGGGGQDSGQIKIQDDLQKIAPKLHELANKDVPMLIICGLYQLFGHFFKTLDGKMIEGIGLLDVETHGGHERLIGNIITESPEFGQIIGFENHSGQTYLGKKATALGKVRKGAGNNGHDDTEGVRFRNVLASYLHGSFLPKNPAVADFLIEKAAINKFGEFTPTVIDDRFATSARKIASKRPR